MSDEDPHENPQPLLVTYLLIDVSMEWINLKFLKSKTPKSRVKVSCFVQNFRWRIISFINSVLVIVFYSGPKNERFPNFGR